MGAGVDSGGYWLTRLKSREPAGAMRAFRDRVIGEAKGAAADG